MKVLLLAVLLAQANTTEFDWEKWEEQIEKETVRLPPTAFPDLPAAVQRDLTARSCSIPQAGGAKKPHNVVRGRFQEAGRTDWAVLCSVNRSSQIIIYRGGNADAPYEMPGSDMPDKQWFQGGVGFSRMLGSADAESIKYFKEEFDGPELPPIDHDGLEEYFVEKASVIYYWHGGAWRALQGAD